MTQNIEYSIFTATYNRAHTLPLLFASLQKQDFRNFEWVIVDDGSTDATQATIAGFQDHAHFPIKLLTQRHQGKMKAHNRGIGSCQGKFFLNIDSDDYVFPYTLSRLRTIWNNLPANKSHRFAGISALSVDPSGNLIGEAFGTAITDSSYDDMYQKGQMGGDRLELWLTTILKKYPYQVAPSECFVPDGIIFHQITRDYQVRFINEALQIVVYQADGISNNSVCYRAQNPVGMELFYQDMKTHLAPSVVKTRCIINLFRYCFHQKKNMTTRPHHLAYVFYLSLLKIVGWLLYVRDLVHINYTSK